MIAKVTSYTAILLLVVFQSCCVSTNAEAMSCQNTNGISEESLRYYSTHSVMTDPGKHVRLYDALPNEIPELCQVARGLMIHVYQAHLYGIILSDQRKKEVSIRRVEDMLGRIIELDDSTLSSPRKSMKRLVGNCRDFTVLLCSFLRHKGIPARARCGFGTYFIPGFHMDHWICEYWSNAEKRWVQIDTQLDSIQKQHYKLDLDSTDLPKGIFQYAGTVYRMCIKGAIDPQKCGIHDLSGLWFVRGNVIRDLMALNKMEVLPWDATELMDEKKNSPGETSTLFETISELTTSQVDRHTEIRAIYQKHPGLRMPPGWKP